MILYVRKWQNRLGNNLNQLVHVLHIALHYNYNILLPNHQFINKRYLVINKNIKKKSKIITAYKDFYKLHYIQKLPRNILNNNVSIVKKLLYDLFVYNSTIKFSAYDLIIHIRGGDIFKNNGANKQYVSPPLSYYINIIEGNNYKRIIIVSEDTRNPCVNELLKRYPSAEFTIQSFEKDIGIIMGAVNIVESYGTLIPALCAISKNIKTIYRPSYQMTRSNKFLNNCNIKKTPLGAYYKKQYPWRNNPRQRKYILTYGMPVEKTHKD